MTVSEVGGPAAWRGPQVADEDSWRYGFDARQTTDLVRAARSLAEQFRHGAERPLTNLTSNDLPVASIEPVTSAIRDQLLRGRGFALVRGLPVDELDALENRLLYWAIGTRVGIPIHQNLDGDVLIPVRDEGKDFSEFGVRAYETPAQLDYHTDSSDVVALYCLRPAMCGGTSTIVSSVAVHDAIVRSRPDLAALLYEPWRQASPVGGDISAKPICALNRHDQLFTRYGRRYIEAASELDPAISQLSESQVETLDLFDDLSNSTDYLLNMDFRPGDIQFLNNYVIMHARTEYADWPDPERKRELLRMWLVFREPLDLPPVLEDSGFIPRTVAFQ